MARPQVAGGSLTRSDSASALGPRPLGRLSMATTASGRHVRRPGTLQGNVVPVGDRISRSRRILAALVGWMVFNCLRIATVLPKNALTALVARQPWSSRWPGADRGQMLNRMTSMVRIRERRARDD